MVESDLNFAGFLIFENKLKDATASTINLLNNANIKSVMVTGILFIFYLFFIKYI
jgi:cation-transporting ATPase 13A2